MSMSRYVSPRRGFASCGEIFSVTAFIHDRSISPVRIVYSHLSIKSLSSVKFRVERYAMFDAPPRLIETYVELAREVEKFLDRFHEAVEFVVTVGIVIDDLQPLTEMRQRIDVVRGVGLSVALDVLDHLAPDGCVALDSEVELL